MADTPPHDDRTKELPPEWIVMLAQMDRSLLAKLLHHVAHTINAKATPMQSGEVSEFSCGMLVINFEPKAAKLIRPHLVELFRKAGLPHLIAPPCPIDHPDPFHGTG